MTAMLLFYPVQGKIQPTNARFSFDFAQVGKNLSDTIQQKLDLGRCKICGENVNVIYDKNIVDANGKPFPEMFTKHLLISTTERCQENLIAERINQLLGTEIELPFGEQQITFFISAATDVKDYENYISKADDLYVPHTLLPICPFPNPPDFQQLNRCPSVSLNLTDYEALMESTDLKSERRLINSLFKLTEMDDNDATDTETAMEGNGITDKDNFKIQVCFEEYLSVIPKEVHGSARAPTETVIIMVVALICSYLLD